MRFLLVFFTSFIYISAQAQAKVIGKIILVDDTEVEFYKRSDLKKIKCDCTIKSLDGFEFFDREDKYAKVKAKEVKKLIVNKGTKLCKQYYDGEISPVTNQSKLDKVFDIITTKELVMYGLPRDKIGRKFGLQCKIYESDDYLMTMYNTSKFNYHLFIYSKASGKLVSGRHHYTAVGYQRQGKLALSEIRKYFHDCPDLLKVMDEGLSYNKGVNRRARKPILKSFVSVPFVFVSPYFGM